MRRFSRYSFGKPLHHFLNTASAPCRRAANRYAEHLAQLFKIDGNFLFFRFVKKIYANKGMLRDFYSLQDKIQVSFEAGSVAYHYHRVGNACFGRTKTDKIPCYFLLSGMSKQRICTWNIYHNIAVISASASSLSVADGFSRPIAGMLLHSGKRIKNR